MRLANDNTSSINLLPNPIPVKSIEGVEALQFEGRERFRIVVRDCNRISDGTFSDGRLCNPCTNPIVSQRSAEIIYG